MADVYRFINGYTEKIELFMTDEKLYQDPDLKLADVISRLKCGQLLFSELLNMELRASFATYITVTESEPHRNC